MFSWENYEIWTIINESHPINCYLKKIQVYDGCMVEHFNLIKQYYYKEMAYKVQQCWRKVYIKSYYYVLLEKKV